MTVGGSTAELAALFIFSTLPEELTRTQAESVLIDSGEFDCIAASETIDELARRGSLYIAEDGSVGISELGEDALQAFEDKRECYLSAINRAVRAYRRIMTGVEYKIDLSAAENGGSLVIFERLDDGVQRLYLKLYFDKSADALAAYNLIDRDPDSAFERLVAVSSGRIS